MPLNLQFDLILQFEPSSLLSPSLLHCQNLDHANEDVDEVEFKSDGLVNGIASEHAALSEAGVVENLLSVVEGEATEDGETWDMLATRRCEYECTV